MAGAEAERTCCVRLRCIETKAQRHVVDAGEEMVRSCQNCAKPLKKEHGKLLAVNRAV